MQMMLKTNRRRQRKKETRVVLGDAMNNDVTRVHPEVPFNVKTGPGDEAGS